MARTYARGYASMASDPKWIDLSWLARGTWSTLWFAAIPLDGRLKSRKHAERLLQRDGCPAEAIAPSVDELIDAELLDVEADGSLVFHDWQEHQPTYRGPSDEPDAAAERKRQQRARERDVSRPVTTSHDVTSGHDGAAIDSTQLNSTQLDATLAGAREGLPNLTDEVLAVLEVATGRTARVAGDRQLTELDRLVQDHGAERVMGSLRHVAELHRAGTGRAPTARQVVWDAVKVLEPFADPKAVAKAAEGQRDRERSTREGEATQRQLEELRQAGERAEADRQRGFTPPRFEDVVGAKP
jgi:hypothetical protein